MQGAVLCLLGVNEMKETLFDILTAIALGLILCALALAYFDVLTK